MFSKASIERALLVALPKDMGASDDVVYAFGECCAEFVNMVASEASELGGKSTVSHAHVVQAMEKLGLAAYLKQARDPAAAEARSKLTSKRKLKPKVTLEQREEAAKRQRQLLDASAENFYREQRS